MQASLFLSLALSSLTATLANSISNGSRPFTGKKRTDSTKTRKQKLKKRQLQVPMPQILEEMVRQRELVISKLSSEDGRFTRRLTQDERRPNMMSAAANNSSMILSSMRSSLRQIGPSSLPSKQPSPSKGNSSPRSEPNQQSLSMPSVWLSSWSMF